MRFNSPHAPGKERKQPAEKSSKQGTYYYVSQAYLVALPILAVFFYAILCRLSGIM